MLQATRFTAWYIRTIPKAEQEHLPFAKAKLVHLQLKWFRWLPLTGASVNQRIANTIGLAQGFLWASNKNLYVNRSGSRLTFCIALGKRFVHSTSMSGSSSPLLVQLVLRTRESTTELCCTTLPSAHTCSLWLITQLQNQIQLPGRSLLVVLGTRSAHARNGGCIVYHSVRSAPAHRGSRDSSILQGC